MKKVIIPVAIFLIITSLASAAVRSVPDDYPTIGAAISASDDGDEVVVIDGIYTGNDNRDLLINRDITIRSENGPDGCIIDCNGTKSEHHRGFSINSNCTIAGFTIVNGYAIEGGAIFSECCENPKIINCVFSNNFAEGQGGALFCHNTDLTVLNSKLFDNSSSNGGAIYCERATLFASNCTISRNIATGDNWESGGGGISCWQESSVTLQNCTVNENISDGTPEGQGGGVCCIESSSLTISNSEIKNNTTRGEHNSIGGGILCSNRSSLILRDSIVTDNTCGGNDSAGGGIFLRDAQPLISKCMIRNNSANTGAGISLESSNSLIWGSIISGNFALDKNEDSSGGIHCMNSSTSIVNCTIVGNSFCGLYRQSGSTNVTNSILYYNGLDYREEISGSGYVNVIYSDVQRLKLGYTPWPGEGNIYADPCFIDSGYWDANGTPYIWEDDFWVEGNYRLLSISPCINTGCPTSYLLDSTDLDGNPRVIGPIDMGAYEFENTTPVANAGLDQTVYACPNGIAKVTLDGSASSDADGHSLAYLWTWTIDSNIYHANGVSPIIELPAGEHIIELIVNDGMTDSEPDEVVITVVEPIESRLLIYLRLIHRNNQRREIMAYLSLPEGITKDQVDDSKSLLLYPGQIEATRQHIFEHHRGGTLHTAIFAIFDKDGLMDAVPGNGKVELQVVGQLKSGQYFYGDDSVWIKD